MALLNSLIRSFYSGRLGQIDNAMRLDPEGVQKRQLQNILRAARHTAFGREHGFGSAGTSSAGASPVISYADFRSRVPVAAYEDYAPWVERMLRGENDVCWPGRIRWFAKSSGTTDAKSKFIPVTRQALDTCHYRGSTDVVAVYIDRHPQSRIYRGKCLTLGGSKKIMEQGSGIQTGDLSAILLGNAPLWSYAFKTPGKSVALLSEWEEKLRAITAATVGQNVTSLAGVPSWFLILLKHIMAHCGTDNIQDVWPGLELFIHGGIAFGPYRKQYQDICPRGINFMETYNASEGFFAIQTDPADPGLQLMLDYGIFFEFVPLAEVGDPFPQGAVPVWEVQEGVDYAIVISTNGGLWRYMMGDTVRFTSLCPHKLVISGRTKLYINAFGEELMIGNAEEAMHRACARTGAVVKEYTAAPVFMAAHTRGCHQWLVEFATPPASTDEFAAILDGELQTVNSDYEAKRYKDITLDPLRLSVAKPGLFFEWMAKHGKVGGQNKVPRLKNDRALIDELLAMNGE